MPIIRSVTSLGDLLAQYLQLSQSGTARLVERLVNQKLVEGHQGKDRRFVHLQVTEAGKAMVEEIQQAFISSNIKFTRAINPTRAETTTTLIV